MLRVYNYMILGLAITGIAALGIYMVSVTDDLTAAAKVVRGGAEIPARLAGNVYLTPLGYAVFVSPLKWVVILAPLALVFGLSFGIERLRPAVAQLLFWIYAALIGISLGSIFMIYTHTSVVRVFFITAASFGALSLWGYTTQRDLTGMGSFLVMGLFGIIIAGTANIFLASRRAGVLRIDRMGHPTPQERVHIRRNGWRHRRADRNHGSTGALPGFCESVHHADPAAWPARGLSRFNYH